MNVLIKNIQQYDVTPSIALQLFDSFVSSSLNYSSPVCDFSKCKDIERVHMKFCKSVLGVKQTTCTVTIYCASPGWLSGERVGLMTWWL